MATASAVSKGAKGAIAPPHPITWPQNPPHARTALSAPPRMGLPCRLLRHNSSLFPLCAVIDATAEDQLGLHLRRRLHRQTAPSSARPPLHSRPRSAWPSPSPWTRHTLLDSLLGIALFGLAHQHALALARLGLALLGTVGTGFSVSCLSAARSWHRHHGPRFAPSLLLLNVPRAFAPAFRARARRDVHLLRASYRAAPRASSPGPLSSSASTS